MPPTSSWGRPLHPIYAPIRGGNAMSPISRPMLSFGSSGDAVRLLQAALNLGKSLLPKLAEDGVFGSKTRGRVVEFQGQNKLLQDGIVGPMTWEALKPWLDLLDAAMKGAQPSAGESSARARIKQVAEQSLALYGWGGILAKDPKTRAVDRQQFAANPLRIAAAYCANSAIPLRP